MSRSDETDEGLPPRAIGRLGSARLRHDAAVTALAFAGDARIVSAGQDERVRVWSAIDGKLLAEAETEAVLCLAVHAAGDGGVIAASGDTRVQWFDLATLAPLGAWEAALAPVAALALSADGARLAVGGFDGSVAVFSRGGEKLFDVVEGGSPALALRWVDQDRALAVACDDGTVRAVDAAGRGAVFDAMLPVARPLLALAERPGGGLLVGGTSPDLYVLGSDGAVGGTLPHGAGERAVSLAVAPGGGDVAVGGTRVASVSITGDPPPRVFPLATGGAARVAVSLGGGLHAVGASSGRISLWDARRGDRAPQSFGPDDEIICVAFSPDGRRLAAGGLDGSVYLGGGVGGALRALAGHGVAKHVRGLAFWDGDVLVSGGDDGSVRVWDARDGTELRRAATAPIRSLAVPPRGVYAFAGGEQGELHRVSLRDGSVRTVQAHKQAVTAICVAPDGSVITGSRDRALRFWDPETLVERRKVNATATAAALSPDGTRLVTVGFGEPARVWDTGNWIERRTLPALSVQSLAFSPDGTRLITAGGDALVRVWDVERREVVDTLEGHTGREVRAVAWSPDGARIASAGADLSVLVWDAALTAR